MNSSHKDVPALAAMAATVLWAGGNVLIKESTVAGPQLAFFRVCFGCALYTIVVAVWRRRRPTLRTIRLSALGGMGFGLQAALFFTALKMTTTASAAVIASLQPVMLLPVSIRFYGERPDRRRIALVAVAIVGTVLVVSGSSGTGTWSLTGDLLALASAVVGCLYFVGTKSARRSLGTLEYQSSALAVAAVCTLPLALLSGDGLYWPTASQWKWPILLTAIAGTGHLLMSWSQKHLTVMFTSTVTLAVLVLTVLGGVVLLDESVDLIQVLGMAVVLGSLALYVRITRVAPEAVVAGVE